MTAPDAVESVVTFSPLTKTLDVDEPISAPMSELAWIDSRVVSIVWVPVHTRPLSGAGREVQSWSSTSPTGPVTSPRGSTPRTELRFRFRAATLPVAVAVVVRPVPVADAEPQPAPRFTRPPSSSSTAPSWESPQTSGFVSPALAVAVVLAWPRTPAPVASAAPVEAALAADEPAVMPWLARVRARAYPVAEPVYVAGVVVVVCAPADPPTIALSRRPANATPPTRRIERMLLLVVWGPTTPGPRDTT